mmetsp:Transcript_287/g.872  ORF Transcript_287/g.872 Transcript_287/m.872 type:complete len:372 (-) Transcript_287:127-1242(-)
MIPEVQKPVGASQIEYADHHTRVLAQKHCHAPMVTVAQRFVDVPQVEVNDKSAEGPAQKQARGPMVTKVQKPLGVPRIGYADGCIVVPLVDMIRSCGASSREECGDRMEFGTLGGLFVFGRSMGSLAHYLDQLSPCAERQPLSSRACIPAIQEGANWAGPSGASALAGASVRARRPCARARAVLLRARVRAVRLVRAGALGPVHVCSAQVQACATWCMHVQACMKWEPAHSAGFRSWLVKDGPCIGASARRPSLSTTLAGGQGPSDRRQVGASPAPASRAAREVSQVALFRGCLWRGDGVLQGCGAGCWCLRPPSLWLRGPAVSRSFGALLGWPAGQIRWPSSGLLCLASSWPPEAGSQCRGSCTGAQGAP